MDITGINGATAYSHSGIEKHQNGSFTMYATIEPYGQLFKETYIGYTISKALKLFREDLQVETDRYIV